ncbi:MAG TPA: hypothetical protein VFT50_01425 [Baekduia sp.]|nr:hypothetical protein [Baekduia sp.]
MTAAHTEYGFSARMRERNVQQALAAQLDAGDTQISVAPPSAGNRRRYDSDSAFWADVLGRRIRSGTPVSLDGFWLSEWVPLSPGLFHTPDAEDHRQMAKARNLSGAGRETAERMLRAEGLGAREAQRLLEELPRMAVHVYDPYGKAQMLSGGIGTVRLAERPSPEGTVWLLGASSSGVMHEGVVVAMPADLYGRYIDAIAARGAIRCRLEGQLRTLEASGDLAALWALEIPRIHLMVESLVEDGRQASPPGSLLATGAVVIERDAAAHEASWSRFCSAYVSFVPGDNPSLAEGVRWLKDTYAGEFLRGRVVTDFDQQVARFSRAPFSISAIAKGEVDRVAALSVVELTGASTTVFNLFADRIDQINAKMAKVTEQRTITIHSGAQVHAPVTIADSIQGSFNRIETGAGDPEVAELLRRLTVAVAELGGDVDGAIASELASDVEVLTTELTKPEPRQRWYKTALESIQETATTLGAVATPVLELVKAIGDAL